jgi:hypothetical protein
MFVLLRMLGLVLMAEEGNNPLFIKRLSDGKYFYYQGKLRYENDEDHERLPIWLLADLMDEPDLYEGEYELSKRRVNGTGEVVPIADHVVGDAPVLVP